MNGRAKGWNRQKIETHVDNLAFGTSIKSPRGTARKIERNIKRRIDPETACLLTVAHPFRKRAAADDRKASFIDAAMKPCLDKSPHHLHPRKDSVTLFYPR
jgi:hypothetical protein